MLILAWMFTTDTQKYCANISCGFISRRVKQTKIRRLWKLWKTTAIEQRTRRRVLVEDRTLNKVVHINVHSKCCKY